MIILVSGSIRKDSINSAFIQLISNRLKEKDHEILNLRDYPMFDPGLEGESVPKVITDLRKRVNESKTLIISTPEYLHNIPSTLKSFLEWLNGIPNLNEIDVIPIVLAPVHPRGEKAIKALILSLMALGFKVSPSMLIHHAELIISKELDEIKGLSEDLEEQIYELITNIIY